MYAPEHIFMMTGTGLTLALADPSSTDTSAFGAQWIVPVMLILGVLILVALGRIATMLVKQGEAMAKLDDLKWLGEIQGSMTKMREDRDDLDLRRLEHVLVDIHDGNKRLEEKLTLTLEHAATEKQSTAESMRPPNLQPGLGERIVNRLLALGYSGVQIVTEAEQLIQLGNEAGTGEVIIEARRDGAHFKGRVLMQDGIIADVAIKPAYDMFP